MVFAELFTDGAFTRAEGIDCEDKKAQPSETGTACLDVRILFGSGPVPMDAQHCRQLS
jgi:hypothetical protein